MLPSYEPVRRQLHEPVGLGATRIRQDLPGRRSRLGELVVEQLVAAVVSGQYPPGSTMPTEPDLSDAFNVSRSVIRESVKILQDKGLVQVRQGQGTTVSPEEEWNLLDPLVLAATIRQDETFRVIDELVSVRASLEAQMAHTAATAVTPEQLAELHATLEQMGALQNDPDSYGRYDVLFHDQVMRISQNRLARNIVRAIQREARASTFYVEGNRSARNCRHAHLGHTRVYDMLAAGDAAGAFAAMEEHIISGWKRRRRSISQDQDR